MGSSVRRCWCCNVGYFECDSIAEDEVEKFLMDIEGVEEVHDLHIWAMSTTETALSTHLVVPDGHEDQFIYDIREQLHDKFEITHTTLQIEKEFGDKEYKPYQGLE